jgi:hypothetical protein
VKECGSGISSTDSRQPLREVMAKICRAPSGRTVSTDISAAASSLLAHESRKRGGTPPSKISRVNEPALVWRARA